MKSAKAELATTIVAAIAGVIIAYFVTGLFIGEIESVSVKTVETEVTADLAEPDQNIFNYKSLNPTVEIYIGSDDTQTSIETSTDTSTDSSTATDTDDANSDSDSSQENS